MANVIVYYAHPGQAYSQVNSAMWAAAQGVEGITLVDLYREYPRFDVDPDREQQRLLDHDVILFQCPLFWYSTPSLVKEWLDIVLEHGFAYGAGGTKLEGKALMFALSAAGPQDAYTPDGYQGRDLRTFLTPLEQTARLCKMQFLPPYVLYGSLKMAREGDVNPHVEGYRQLLTSLREEGAAGVPPNAKDVVTHLDFPQTVEA